MNVIQHLIDVFADSVAADQMDSRNEKTTDEYRRARRALVDAISASQRAVEDGGAQEAAYAMHHCESDGCAHEMAYTKRAAKWADQYHAMKAEIAQLRDAAQAVVRGWQDNMTEIEQFGPLIDTLRAVLATNPAPGECTTADRQPPAQAVTGEPGSGT